MVTVAGVDHCPLGSCWTRAIVLPARGVPVEVALRVPERVNSRLALGVVLEAAMDRVVSSTDNEASPTSLTVGCSDFDTLSADPKVSG